MEGNVDGYRVRVLVIDDEVNFGRLVGRMLEREHDVVALTSAQEALARIGAGERFDLVFCDLMMPEMTGMDFVEHLARVAPELLGRLVLITGGAFTPGAEAFLEQTSIPRLEKPFSLDELRAVVREQLPRPA
jgi:DNA-binding NtrC family response regulator